MIGNVKVSGTGIILNLKRSVEIKRKREIRQKKSKETINMNYLCP